MSSDPPNPDLVSEERPVEALAVFDADAPAPRHNAIRVLSKEESDQRLAKGVAEGRFARLGHVRPEDPAAAAARARAEADVVDVARRSQAEIRRHVDSYLKEHFENIAADVAAVVVDQVHDRITRGVASMQEQQMIALDRIAADVRAQLRAFARDAWGEAPAKSAPRARSGARRAQKRR